MAFTPEQRAKAVATRKAKAEAKRKGLMEVASMKAAPPESQDALKQRIADLEARLQESESKRSDAEKLALASAESQGRLMQRDIQEIPTGKTVKVMRLSHYKEVGHKDDGRPIIKPVFKSVSVPTFFYKIDMPPCGGTDLKINGDPFYHGAVYEVDEDTLRTLKEIVYRTWKHDAEIHGSDENFYRKKGAYESANTYAVPQLRAR